MLVRKVQACLNFQKEATQCARNVMARLDVRIAQGLARRDTRDTARWETEVAVLSAPAQECVGSATVKDASNCLPRSGHWPQHLRCALA
jgi:hypothetical protein